MIIALIDDHPVLTEAIKNLLLQQPGVGQVKSFDSASVFLEQRMLPAPDLIITDLMMPGINGIKFIEICRETLNSDIKIIVLSSIIDVQTIKHAIRMGANGFLSKSSNLEELLDAIAEVKDGKQYIAKNLRDNMLNSMFTEEQVIYHLSPREKDVLKRVCSGLTIKEIAYELKLSVHTVQYYHRIVLNKLKVKRTSDLIVFAIQNGLYHPDLDKKV